jgi:hypothetical protein
VLVELVQETSKEGMMQEVVMQAWEALKTSVWEAPMTQVREVPTTQA